MNKTNLIIGGMLGILAIIGIGLIYYQGTGRQTVQQPVEMGTAFCQFEFPTAENVSNVWCDDVCKKTHPSGQGTCGGKGDSIGSMYCDGKAQCVCSQSCASDQDCSTFSNSACVDNSCKKLSCTAMCQKQNLDGGSCKEGMCWCQKQG